MKNFLIRITSLFTFKVDYKRFYNINNIGLLVIGLCIFSGFYIDSFILMPLVMITIIVMIAVLMITNMSDVYPDLPIQKSEYYLCRLYVIYPEFMKKALVDRNISNDFAFIKMIQTMGNNRNFPHINVYRSLMTLLNYEVDPNEMDYSAVKFKYEIKKFKKYIRTHKPMLKFHEL